MSPTCAVVFCLVISIAYGNELCVTPADIAFLIDSSKSIWFKYFKIQLQFVNKLISSTFNVSPVDAQVAALTFSRYVVPQFHFKDYTNKTDVLEKVATIRQDNGDHTNTHEALMLALDALFAPGNGVRGDVPHICILLTDGNSTYHNQTLSAAKAVKNAGIKIITVGVGYKINIDELQTIASPPAEKNFFKINKFEDLESMEWAVLIGQQACEEAAITTTAPETTTKMHNDQPECPSVCDIMFGLHGIGGDAKEHVTEFIKNVGGAFIDVSKNVRLGLKESCNKAEFLLTDFSGERDFATAVQEQMFVRVADLLSEIRTGFGNSRPDATRIVVLILSGKVDDVDRAYVEAMRLKYSARVIVVGLGKSVDRDQLIRLASYEDKMKPDISHVFPVDSTADLADIVKKLHVLICRNSQ